MTLDAVVLATLGPLWKAASTALLIIGIGRLAVRAGPVLTSVFMTLPLNAAPGFFFVSLVLDDAFVAESALYAMAGAGAVLVYLTAFRQAARSGSFAFSLIAGACAWTAVAWPLAVMSLDIWTALACVLFGAVVAAAFDRRTPARDSAGISVAGWRYLLVRAAVAGVLIASVATLAPVIGPVASGLLLSFPTLMMTSGWMLHGHYGLDFVTSVYGSARPAMALYVLYFVLLLPMLELLPGPVAVVLSLLAVGAVAGAVARLLLWLAERRRRTG